MTDYLDYVFNDSPEFVSTFDELPLWSASFGLLLLKHLELRQGITLLDIGSGAGFPLLELAQRLGSSCKCYGIDPWVNANNRVREKIKNYAIKNVEVIDGSADQLPFEDNTVDIVVSNLGANNFDDPEKVFKECCRVLKPGAKLALTTNLNGHWREFYNLFEETLRQMGRTDLVEPLIKHQEHRGTVATVSTMFTDSGFEVVQSFEEKLEMKFANGTAFLNHYFVKLGWLASWKALIPAEILSDFFERLEANLNAYATNNGGLTLTVPMAFIEGQKKANK